MCYLILLVKDDNPHFLLRLILLVLHNLLVQNHLFHLHRLLLIKLLKILKVNHYLLMNYLLHS